MQVSKLEQKCRFWKYSVTQKFGFTTVYSNYQINRNVAWW
jgi:hypothetical protein